MSLPGPAPRRHLHTRTITLEGYGREDGLFDVEAQIVDTKTYDTEEPFRGVRKAGAHVHNMQLRLTIDSGMVVRGVEVTTNAAPYDPCFTVAPAYEKLVGATIGMGWHRAVQDAVGGVKGCTHLRELLMPAATVAYQTIGSWPKAGVSKGQVKPVGDQRKPYFLDGCKAWSTEGEVVQQLYPMHYRGPVRG
jgi:hypothetical protein